MDFEKLISDRYSVRNFRSDHLPKAVVDRILDAGHKAPTGCNYQTQRIIVMNTDESIAKLKKCTKCHFNAPTAMLVCHNKEESWVRKYDGALSSPVDAVIVTTHMMLEVTDLGLGSTWVGAFSPEKAREIYNVPENYEIALEKYAEKCRYIMSVMRVIDDEVCLYNYDIKSSELPEFMKALEDKTLVGKLIEIEKYIPEDLA